jgi:orotidine 5'-phosphate decarboxylase subfamily 1
VELEPGVEGLVHVSEMSWTKKNVHPGKIVATSQEVDVMVLDVDSGKRRISLGLKQVQRNPWEQFVEEHPIGSEVEGEIRNITEFGLFVGLPGGHRRHGPHVRPVVGRAGELAMAKYEKGQVVKAKVLDVDVEKERISLGIKQLQATIRRRRCSESVHKGDVVTCIVTAIQSNGIEVKVGDVLTGFIRRAELARDKGDQRPDRFAVGEKVDAKITGRSRGAQADLTIKGKEIEEEKQAMAEFGSSDSWATSSVRLAGRHPGTKSELIQRLAERNPHLYQRDVERIVATVFAPRSALEFFTANGPRVVKETAQGLPLFLDLKLHDIPNTVAGAVKAAAALEPLLLTVHCAGGAAMMKAAAEAKGKTKILGVTVLTSLDERDLELIGQRGPLAEQAQRLALLAKESGLDGVICSPLETAALRQACGPDFLLVVPGIRIGSLALGDQKRVMGPKDAIAAGADYIVIGRPITGSPSPASAARAMLVDIGGR